MYISFSNVFLASPELFSVISIHMIVIISCHFQHQSCLNRLPLVHLFLPSSYSCPLLLSIYLLMHICWTGMGSEVPMELPPGFRFHPTDEELITHYLSKKVVDGNFSCRAIGDVDLNKCEPWDLHWKAKMGEKEWCFFCVKDRKYPTGLRTNRATEAGYWKATGKDKEIHKGKILVGMKKTLVFYRGRAPKGEKTYWVMHEYRIEGKSPFQSLPKSAKNEWVICRVFQKNLVVKRSYGKEMGFSRIHLPPLTETSYATAPEGYFTTNLFSTPTNNTENIPSFDVISKMAFNSSIFSGVVINSSDGECKFDGEMVSVSQDTGLTSDVNPEISSMFSTHRDVGKQMLYSGELPLTPATVTTMDDCRLWNY